MQTELTYPRMNKDESLKAAYYMLKDNGPGAYELHGTTRSGRSTGTAAESANRNEKLVAIIPNNAIKTGTFDERKINSYSDRRDVTIIHSTANKECLYNQELIDLHPAVGSLPYLPIPWKCVEFDDNGKPVEGSQCEHFGTCPVVAMLRDGLADISVLTYNKLVALVLSAMAAINEGRMNIAIKILDQLKKADTQLFDEVHTLQIGHSCSLTVRTCIKKNNIVIPIDLNRYQAIRSFGYLQYYLKGFVAILADADTMAAVDDIEGKAQAKDAWKKHLGKTVKNNHLTVLNEKGETMDLDNPRILIGAYTEIIELAKDLEGFGLDVEDLLDIYKIMMIAAAQHITIHADRSFGLQINLVADDVMFRQMIKRYTKAINPDKSRIVFTSATIGSTKLEDFLPYGATLKKIRFGHRGDPKHTNEKMTILADHKKYSAIGRYSIEGNMRTIVDQICQILDIEGDIECFIITRSGRLAKKIERELAKVGRSVKVDYYRSDQTMGISNGRRVCIAIGLAESPANSFDAITKSTAQSRAMRIEAVLADTWQAWSRVKDPQGKCVSLVYALGCNSKQCEEVGSWGSDWKLDFTNEDLTEYEIKHANDITRPNVIACKDIEDMLKKGGVLHKFSSQNLKVPKMPYIISIGQNSHFDDSTKELTKYNQEAEHLLGQNTPIRKYILTGKYWFLQRIAHNREKFLEGNYEGGWFTNYAQLSDSLIQSHADGKGVIGVYPIAPDGTVSWICFDVDGHPRVEKQIEDLNKWYIKQIREVEAIYAAAVGSEGYTPEIEAYDKETRERLMYEFEERMQALREKRNRGDDACFAAADAQLNCLTSYLDAQNIPYKLESSGGAHSYHVWIFLKPVHAKIARAFGELINTKSGAQVAEINPKQVAKGGQNGVKLPFANYGYLKPSMGSKRLKRSLLMDKGAFVDDIAEIEIQELDISNFIFDKPIALDAPKEKKAYRPKDAFDAYGIRPIFVWAMTQQLEGYQGNRCRVALAREYIANGLTDPEAVARLFEHQSDYSFEESLRQVNSIMKQDFGPWKNETMEYEFKDIIACFDSGTDFDYTKYEFKKAPGEGK